MAIKGKNVRLTPQQVEELAEHVNSTTQTDSQMLRKLESLPVSADGKALLADLLKITTRVGDVVLKIGRKILDFVLNLVRQFPHLGFAAVLALVVILVLLQSDFQSPRLVAVVFLSLPFALIGGIAGIALGGGVISLGSVVGFVAVLGIAARNGIMLVSHYRHLQEAEGLAFGPELVQPGACERLVPILMTALTAMLALVPIVWGGNLPGYEIEYPMALVILGGMLSSTVLSLFLLPTFYLWLGRR